jgi:hypothetical protein
MVSVMKIEKSRDCMSTWLCPRFQKVKPLNDHALHIRRISPDRDEGSFKDCEPLLWVWHSVLSIVAGFLIIRGVASTGDNILDLFT